MSLSKDSETRGLDPRTGISTEHDNVSVHQERSRSPDPSCVSMKSDNSKEGLPPLFSETSPSEPGITTLSRLEEQIIYLVKNELKRFWTILNPGRIKCSERESGKKENQISIREETLNITLHVLRNMNENDLADILEETEPLLACRHILKSNLKNKYQCVSEGIAKQGNSTLLNKIYTELYITEGGSGEVNNEHEVRQIERASRRPATEETPIQCNDIFKPLPGEDKPIRTVLTKGVAGIGKTVSVQKFILDWSEGKSNQDLRFMFPLPFRELNLIKGKKLSLTEMLHLFYPETKELVFTQSDKHKIAFIFDGLDECRIPLDFQSSERLCNATEPASVDVLLTNLIKGNLLPSALLWITSRPASANQMPPECVDRVTEIRGFNDTQKEEYIRKRVSDQNLADKIITHVKSSRSLYIMCHIPVFCWISSTVLERMLGEAYSGQIPKTLTNMYTHFLRYQMNQRNRKYDENFQMHQSVLLLGKLAFEHLEKGHLVFYENDLKECGIDITDASVYSGVFTQIFREESGLHQETVYSFVHLSIQEFLAALYVFLMFINDDKNVLCSEEAIKTNPAMTSQGMSVTDVHKSAVDKTLASNNGHLDLFLRFLLGLSLESNHALLHELLTPRGRISQNKDETVKYIKKKFTEELSQERSINLLHCLNELNDHSLVEQIQSYLRSGRLPKTDLSPAQWSALVFVLLTSQEKLDVFDLKRFIRSDECLLRLLPVVKVSRTALLSNCNLTEQTCKALASVLDSEISSLRELDLSNNSLGDSGVDLLCAGLKNPHCKLESLRLACCDITDEGCSALASVLSLEPSHLRELDLSYNNIGRKGAKLLSAALTKPQCNLELLKLSDCSITQDGCAALASALNSNPTHLRELDLSYNKAGDTGLKLLSTLLKDQKCELDTLKLSDCSITEEGCAALSSALDSNPSHLRELDLSWNKPGDSGIKALSAVLKKTSCKLEILRLLDCSLTEKGCVALASALSSNPSHLRELDLNNNKPGDSGVKLVSSALLNPNCKLETLKLSNCRITLEGFAALASALSSNLSHLRELDLSWNSSGDSGVKMLSVVLRDPQCKLEKLRLCSCRIKEDGCVALASALGSNPSHLRELDLSLNKVGDLGAKQLSAPLKNSLCKLEKLRLYYCCITEEGFAALAKSLSSNPSHLRELDLSYGKSGATGANLLSGVLKNPQCNLESLRLSDCSMTEESCAPLASALRSNPSHLKELDLSRNELGGSGAKSLAELLKYKQFKLEKLKLSYCSVSEEGCAALASALGSNHTHLKELDLSHNTLGNSGVKLLSAVLKNLHCKLVHLRLSGCGITEEGCAVLASVLGSKPSHLRELDLSNNTFHDSGVKLLSDFLKNPNCKLEDLWLCNCSITAEGFSFLALALKSNPSAVRKLVLHDNQPGNTKVNLLSILQEDPHCALETVQ
ncbi:NACHT, LRR and PYD domains-containing protein 3-like [Chanos chanos]|uniref:NACHT, LRR and PYD domains-containing protein 3-like n=1 Tax=Chanos chanos TaxID=29144 RepID=A0A6J2WP46_CHACN|nr:NACHT, LRR and PYD domains-containing protein 3-like [Chanos chanos]